MTDHVHERGPGRSPSKFPHTSRGEAPANPPTRHLRSGAKPSSSPPHTGVGGVLGTVGGERRGDPPKSAYRSGSEQLGLCLLKGRRQSGAPGCSDPGPQLAPAGPERCASRTEPLSIVRSRNPHCRSRTGAVRSWRASLGFLGHHCLPPRIPNGLSGPKVQPTHAVFFIADFKKL